MIDGRKRQILERKEWNGKEGFTEREHDDVGALRLHLVHESVVLDGHRLGDITHISRESWHPGLPQRSSATIGVVVDENGELEQRIVVPQGHVTTKLSTQA